MDHRSKHALDNHWPLTVYFVLQPDFLLLDLAAAAEPLRLANELSDRVLFELRYVAAKPTVKSSLGLTVAPIENLPARLPSRALVVLLGTRSRSAKNYAEDRQLNRWLTSTLDPSHLLLCICTGALQAAAAGLLDGRDCTTHHTYCSTLASKHPKARVHNNRIFVRDGNIFTSAGVTAGIDVTLFLIELLAGDELAISVARELAVYLRRNSKDPQLSPTLSHRNHLHPLIHRIQDAVIQSPQARWTLRSMAKVGHLSPRHLTRLFPVCTGVTPASFVTMTRLSRARELLENRSLDVERIAEESGFNSSRQFRRAFREHFGDPPSRWRREFSLSAS